MILLTRLNGEVMGLNSDLIEWLEETPDTVIHMVSSETFMVRERLDEVTRRVVQFRRATCGGYGGREWISLTKTISEHHGDSNE